MFPGLHEHAAHPARHGLPFRALLPHCLPPHHARAYSTFARIVKMSPMMWSFSSSTKVVSSSFSGPFLPLF